MSIWQWEEGIDPVSPEHQLCLGEGNTPVIPAREIGRELGIHQLYFKLETMNPSGSYKDRFAAAAISHMLQAGENRCIATSSGNTGAALAAYSAAAGIRCEIAVVETAPLGKLEQMLAYGAYVYRVRGFGTNPTITDAVFNRLQELAAEPDAAMQVSAFKYSPKGMSGVRSAGLELLQQVPAGSHIFCPAGGGGLAMAVAEMAAAHPEHPLKVHCVQPEGNNTISGPLAEGKESAQNIDCTTEISGLQVASVVDGNETIRACRSTGGTGILVEDQKTWDIQRRLSEREGVFAEPAGSIAVAAALQAVESGIASPDEPLVCLITGSGFKDPKSVQRMNEGRECPLMDVDEIR